MSVTNLSRTDALAVTRAIKSTAVQAGLAVASVTSAAPFFELESMLQDHISAGRMTGLDWFTSERATFSLDPRNLMPTVRSIVSLGIPYWNVAIDKPNDEPRGTISRYARGTDYHRVLKQRMRALHSLLEGQLGEPLEARFLVDTARIVDRAVAARSGLGWYGKHSCIIVPGHGSWVMLGELLLDIDLVPDPPLARDCGRCTICLDQCPTGAIVAPYTVDTPRCLSFQTIEQRGAIPRELRAHLGDWVFGCDICQEVCPYTGAAKPAADPDFAPRSLDNAFPRLRWLLTMTETEFRATYRGTAVLRTKRRGLARNAAIAIGNVGSEDDLPWLRRTITDHDEPTVRSHAAWAVGAISGAANRAFIADRVRIEPDSDAKLDMQQTLDEMCS